MRAAHISSALEDIPVDFLGDPDGCWDYEQLAQVAGFDQLGLDQAGLDQAGLDQNAGQLSIGALTEPYAGFPDGAAVVIFRSVERCAIALVDCVASSSRFAMLDSHELRSELQSELPGELRSEPRNDSWGSALGNTGTGNSVSGSFAADTFGPDARRNDVAA